MVLLVLRLSESESIITSSYSVYVCDHDSETYYSRNFKFGILHLYRMILFQTFYEVQTNSLHTGAHKRIRIH